MANCCECARASVPTDAEKVAILRAAASSLRSEDASILYTALGDALTKARAEAWREGYEAASYDERESMPDHSKNPYINPCAKEK